MRELGGCLFLVVGLILLIVFFPFLGIRAYKFKENCGDYLKLAGAAPTVEKANYFLEKALAYMEKTGRTSGNSAVIFRTPTSDVGIWYSQTKAAKQTLEKIIAKGEGATQFEKDNALMKIMETVMDQGCVTVPMNISLFPYQFLIIIIWPVVTIFFLLFGFFVATFRD